VRARAAVGDTEEGVTPHPPRKLASSPNPQTTIARLTGEAAKGRSRIDF
jgi:hypothetical protein